MHMPHVFSRIMTLVTITVAAAFPADSKHSFTFGRKEFLLDGKPVQIISLRRKRLRAGCDEL